MEKKYYTNISLKRIPTDFDKNQTIAGLCESDVEEAVRDNFHEIGYDVLYGYEVAPGDRIDVLESIRGRRDEEKFLRG